MITMWLASMVAVALGDGVVAVGDVVVCDHFLLLVMLLICFYVVGGDLFLCW